MESPGYAFPLLKQHFTFDANANVLQAPLLQHSFGHVPVLDVLEESVQLGTVKDLRNKRGD